MRGRYDWVALIGASVVVGGWLGSRLSPPPERCGEGLVSMGPRCCGEGQALAGPRCAGAPRRCGARQRVTEAGCVVADERVRIPGGRVTVGPSDWEAQGVVQPRQITVGPFWLDRFEATAERQARCAAAGACEPPRGDPGQAVALTLAQASALCGWAGGRLPTDDEWTFAAMGPAARRYPWGDTGAVCRRAAYGLVSGPCGQGATGPDTVGSRPDGDSPDGLVDLAGNVAEWALLPGGAARRRGGSFRSSLAAELRGWNGGAGEDDGATGVRCAYDAP